MSKNKINLEEILSKEFEGISLLSTINAREVTLNAIKNAMLEFGKQLLELASENAILILNEGESYSFVENFPKNLYFEYEGIPNSVAIDEQSILDTIKQVE